VSLEAEQLVYLRPHEQEFNGATCTFRMLVSALQSLLEAVVTVATPAGSVGIVAKYADPPHAPTRQLVSEIPEL